MLVNRTFSTVFLASALAFGTLVGLFILNIDPYGVSPIGLPIQRPIMDINQRYMYPQVARKAEFDSAVFGTSTVRLLDPRKLSDAFGGNFANLAMNAATPWEQTRMAKLFLRRHQSPRTLIFGFDTTWCESDADRKRVTFRGFPESFYGDGIILDLKHQVNLRSLEIAGRLLAYHLGFAKERVAANGFEVFLPEDGLYDAARARATIWAGKQKPTGLPSHDPPLSLAEVTALRFPALDWLEEVFADIPRGSRAIVLLPPIHVAYQTRPGTQPAQIEGLCHARLKMLAQRAGIPVVNMQITSSITSVDENYWDALHYRIAFADEIITTLATASAPGAADGPTYRRLDR